MPAKLTQLSRRFGNAIHVRLKLLQQHAVAGIDVISGKELPQPAAAAKYSPANDIRLDNLTAPVDGDRAAGLRRLGTAQGIGWKQIDCFRQIKVVIVDIALRHPQEVPGNRGMSLLFRSCIRLLDAGSIVDKLR